MSISFEGIRKLYFIYSIILQCILLDILRYALSFFVQTRVTIQRAYKWSWLPMSVFEETPFHSRGFLLHCSLYEQTMSLITLSNWYRRKPSVRRRSNKGRLRIKGLGKWRVSLTLKVAWTNATCDVLEVFLWEHAMSSLMTLRCHSFSLERYSA